MKSERWFKTTTFYSSITCPNVCLKLAATSSKQSLKGKWLSTCLPHNLGIVGFEPHTGHDHDSSYDTSTGWFMVHILWLNGHLPICWNAAPNLRTFWHVICIKSKLALINPALAYRTLMSSLVLLRCLHMSEIKTWTNAWKDVFLHHWKLERLSYDL